MNSEVCKKCSNGNFSGDCHLSAGLKQSCLSNYYTEYVTYQCINESCGWEGKKQECSKHKNDKYCERPLCPECYEVVEKNTDYLN